MALVLLDMIKKMSGSFCKEFIPEIEKAGIKFDKERETRFAQEAVIIHFWIVSKALSPDEKVLDELHKTHLYGRSIFSQAETDDEVKKIIKQEEEKLNKRYQEYYKHFDAKAESVLALTMLENMIKPEGPEKKKLTDIRLMFYVSSHVFEMIKAVLNLRKTIEITDL